MWEFFGAGPGFLNRLSDALGRNPLDYNNYEVAKGRAVDRVMTIPRQVGVGTCRRRAGLGQDHCHVLLKAQVVPPAIQPQLLFQPGQFGPAVPGKVTPSCKAGLPRLLWRGPGPLGLRSRSAYTWQTSSPQNGNRPGTAGLGHTPSRSGAGVCSGWQKLVAFWTGLAIRVGLGLSKLSLRQKPTLPPEESYAPPITSRRYSSPEVVSKEPPVMAGRYILQHGCPGRAVLRTLHRAPKQPG